MEEETTEGGAGEDQEAAREAGAGALAILDRLSSERSSRSLSTSPSRTSERTLMRQS